MPIDTDFADLLYHPAAVDGAVVHAPVFGPTFRLLITTLNALPTQPAGTCPTAGHETAQITVDEGPQRLQFQTTLGSCGFVEVTFAGVRQPSLKVNDALRTLIRRAALPPPPWPAPGPLEPVLHRSAHNPRAATVQADAALLLVHLPEAVQTAAAVAVPPDDVFTLGTPSVVERQTTWLSALTPQDLVDYVGAHAPAGFNASGSGYDDASLNQDFTTVANPHVILRLVVTARGSGSAVVVNAQVFWTPPKPLAELIAPNVASATLRYVPPHDMDGKRGRTRNLTLRGTALARIERVLNALPTRTLDVLSGCAAGFGETATFRFHSRGRLLVFTIEMDACYLVHVSSGKETLPVLLYTDDLAAALKTLVGRG